MKGNPVKFIYVSAGKSRPTPIDPDAIYFLEGQRQIWVGNELIADSVDPIDIDSYLESYRVKSAVVVGSGDTIEDASFDDETGRLTLVRGNVPGINKGSSTEPAVIRLTPGSSFTTVTDISVSGRTIYDQKVKFILPDDSGSGGGGPSVTGVSVRPGSTESDPPEIVVSYSDGTSSNYPVPALSSIIFESADNFATAEQGELAESAMQSVNGTATGATISLAADPVDALDAATKQYVDDAVASIGTPLDYIGVSSTSITDGGVEHPTIDGQSVDPSTLTPGSVVLYGSKEFVWNGEHWNEFGDTSSFAPITTRVTGGDGLTGGGDLSSDVTISHAVTGSGSDETFQPIYSETNITAITQLVVDKFGHIADITFEDVSSEIRSFVEPIATDIAEVVSAEIAESVISAAKPEIVEDVLSQIVIPEVPEYSIIKDDEPTEGGTTYYLAKDGEPILTSSINVPEMGLIESGSVETVEEPDVPYDGAVVGDKYIDFVLSTDPPTHIYIPVSDLANTYEAGPGISISNRIIGHDETGLNEQFLSSAVRMVSPDASIENPTVLDYHYFLDHKNVYVNDTGHVDVVESASPTGSPVEFCTREQVEELIRAAELRWRVEAAST